MKTIKQINVKSIIHYLRSFSYTYLGKNYTFDFCTTDDEDIFTMLYLQKFGSLFASDIAIAYDNNAISAESVAKLIRKYSKEQWIHLLNINQSEYNPLWNVDGTEERTVITKYGKITKNTGDTTTEYGKTTTNGGSTTTSYGKTSTDSGTTKTDNDGSNSTTNNLTNKTDNNLNNTTNNPTVTSTDGVTTFDTELFQDKSKNVTTYAGETVNKQTGSVTNTNTGTTGTSFEDSTTVTNNLVNTEGGQDVVTNNLTNKDSGSDKVTNNLTNADSGQDETKDTFVRGGNIGTTMTQQLEEAEVAFWEKFNIYDIFFKSLNNILTIPLYESGDY